MLVECKSRTAGLFRAILTQAITLNELQIPLDAKHFLRITNLVVSELGTELEEVNKSYMLLLISFLFPQKAIQNFASSTG